MILFGQSQRLRLLIQFSLVIDALVLLLTLAFGCELPLLQIPSPFVGTNNNSTLLESEFGESAISELFSFHITCYFSFHASGND